MVLLSNSEQPTGPVGYGLTIQRIEPIARLTPQFSLDEGHKKSLRCRRLFLSERLKNYSLLAFLSNFPYF